MTAAPEQFDFGDWDEFCSKALQFHEATRPGDQLVVQRIETFRGLMSEKVLLYLGSFVNSHPRFYTVKGWDKWTEDVSRMLAVRSRGPAGYEGTPVTSETPEDAIAGYKHWRLSLRLLWHELDTHVVAGRLSSRDQRQLFWDALPSQRRAQLAEQCPLIEADEVWEKPDSDACKVAEQALARAAEFTIVDELWRYLSVLRAIVGAIVGRSLLTNFIEGLELAKAGEMELCAAKTITVLFTLMVGAWLVLRWLRPKFRELRALRAEMSRAATS